MPGSDDTSDRVRCSFCGEVYDLAMVTVTARYADCSMFLTPCCGRTADDREWLSLPSFRRTAARLTVDGVWVWWGEMHDCWEAGFCSHERVPVDPAEAGFA